MSLVANNLSVGYGPCAVMEGVNINVQAGQALCMLGPNGCGKSTLIKTLLGLLPPIAGTVFLNNKNLHTIPPTLRARQLAYVPQNQGLAFNFSVHEVVLMGRTAHWGLLHGPSQQDHADVVLQLESLGIATLQHRAFNALSGGQQQLVLIARALYQGANCLVMDEPTANLDVANASRVLRTALELCKHQGFSLVFSSHNPQEALTHNTSVLLLKDRRVLAQGDAHQTLNADHLSQLYGLPAQVHNLQAHPVVVWS
ncbi:MAG TPA: ABC transporter ATP-binding protein [Limnobacter sp.]|nr:ABC transporter ATP-binding protein [Limnobacter sp.]